MQLRSVSLDVLAISLPVPYILVCLEARGFALCVPRLQASNFLS